MLHTLGQSQFTLFTGQGLRNRPRPLPENSKALPELYATIPWDFNSGNPEVTLASNHVGD